MKVRVKLAGTARTVDVGDIQNCTLSDLQQKTADVFELGDTSFHLSLNKKDALSGEDLTLSQLGIVPGDLVFLLGPDLSSNNSSSSNVTSSPSTSANNCGNGTGTAEGGSGVGSQESGGGGGVGGGKEEEEGSQAVESAMSQNSWQENSQDQETSGLSDVDGHPSCSGAERDSPSPCPLEDPEVNRCLQEPLLCRESTPASVPALLRDVFSAAACGTAADALWVVLHTLMLEVGFRPLQEGELCLEAGWNKRGFYRQDYRHLCVHSHHSCSLIAVPMGQVVVVHGVTNGDPPLKTDPQSLKVGDYVQSGDMDRDVCGLYSNLERLSRVVKDEICHPLMGQLSEVCGFAVSVGLLSLSYEVQLKVLSYLPASAVTRVGQVCRSLNAVYKDPCVWRRLYLREFGQKEDNSLNKNWYQLYKEALQLRKERRRLSRHRQQMMMSIPPWLHPPHGHFTPFPPSGFHGGVIGGDYDLNPDFASTIPHPLGGGQPRHPNPFFPHGPMMPGGPFHPRPRFDDPFGPGSGPHFMALGPRATRSSTSSTFNRSLGGHRFM